MTDEVQFDILVTSPGSASGREPSAENLAELRPGVEDVERCRQWLAARSVSCHATGFGLACTATHAVFRRLFGSREEPRPPAEIAGLVAQITVARPPEYFD